MIQCLLLQEFVPHAGVLFKVCVIGDAVVAVQRMSVDPGRGAASIAPQTDLDRVSKQPPPPGIAGAAPPAGAILRAADVIAQTLGLTLFNFDFVTESVAADGEEQMESDSLGSLRGSAAG